MRCAQNWSPAAGITLEPNALRAATETGRSVALTAGPGAGKTEVLAQRADFLFRTNTSEFPRRILAISFKVDASQNLASRVRDRCGLDYSNRLDSRTFHAFAKRLIDRYRLALNSHYPLAPEFTIGDGGSPDYVTFDDLIPLASHILRTNRYARNALRQTYSHIMLDEFQDCTAKQYDLIRTAFLGSGCTLTAVGDTKQRIMGFAGALEGVFELFAEEFDAVPLNMYQNHRSAPRIRRVHNAMVRALDPEAAVASSDLVGDAGEVRTRAFDNSGLEAEKVAAGIAARLSAGLPPSEIAVIVTREPHYFLRELIERFDEQSIPYRNEQAEQDTVAEPLFGLIRDFLLVVLSERSPDAYSRLMRLLVETDLADEFEYSSRDRWERYISHWRAKFDRDALAENERVIRAIQYFLDRIGDSAVRALSASYEYGNYAEKVRTKTLEMVRTVFVEDRSYSSCVSMLGAQEAVRILTVHKSKGLEFDTVYVIGVEEDLYALTDTGRCTFFVAISRAKNSLLLTTAARRRAPDDMPEWRARKWKQRTRPNGTFLGYAQEIEQGSGLD